MPQELGLKVCVVEDQYGFFLHHVVMRSSTDDKVAVPLIEAARKRFPQVVSCSFDKSLHTPENRKQLERM